MQPLVALVLFALYLVPASSAAALISLGGGLVYDEYSDITWLADANHARTSGYDEDGAMSWQAAMDWVQHLVFAGHDEWRLPTVYNPDGRLCLHPNACTESELGHLFYTELGGTYMHSIYESIDPDIALFSNIITSAQIDPAGLYQNYDTYWTRDMAWNPRSYYFAFTNGSQWAKNQDDPFGHGWGLAWAVHDGRLVQGIPTPATWLLMLIGFAATLAARMPRR